MAKRIEQVIGENIKRLREQKGMSQVELGEEVGLLLATKWVPQTVSAAERGKRQFIAAEMVVLADVLDCRIQYLFESPDASSIKVSDAFTFTPDFSSRVESLQVNDEGLLRMYSKLRISLMGVPHLTAALKEDIQRLEALTEHAKFLLDLEDASSEVDDQDA